MDRFVSNFMLRLDAKGRVSIPAAYRAVLARDGYDGLYCYPTIDRPQIRMDRVVPAGLVADCPRGAGVARRCCLRTYVTWACPLPKLTPSDHDSSHGLLMCSK